MQNNSSRLFLVTLLNFILCISCTDYCNPNLCQDGERHIACSHSGKWARNCFKPKMITLTDADKDDIVHLHNGLRNKIALGKQHPFPSAVKMQTLQWDEELASLARLNVMQCEMRHDECHNTQKYKWTGQNLGASHAKNRLDNKERITILVAKWYLEHHHTPVEAIYEYPEVDLPYSIGHFTEMVQDKVSRIGCAVSNYVKYNQYYVLLACNYNFVNVIGAPVYKAGQTVSSCATGSNPKYPGLCSIKENVATTPYESVFHFNLL